MELSLFKNMKEIAFAVPDNAKEANIFVQPQNAKSIFFLKQFKL